MNGAGAQLMECAMMLASAVSFVLGQSITGELAVKRDHQLIAGDLGHDTGGSDAQAGIVRFWERALRKIDGGQAHIIQDQCSDRGLQFIEGANHGLPGSFDDAQGVYFLCAGPSDADIPCNSLNGCQ